MVEGNTCIEICRLQWTAKDMFMLQHLERDNQTCSIRVMVTMVTTVTMVTVNIPTIKHMAARGAENGNIMKSPEVGKGDLARLMGC